MIEERVECKRLGNEYKNLFEKVIYFIHHTPFAKEFISDNDLKMLSDLDLYLHTGKYEIIEFGTRKSPFDVTNALQEKDEEIERLKEINDNLYDKLVGWLGDYENTIVCSDVFGKYIYVDDLVSKIEELKEGK